MSLAVLAPLIFTGCGYIHFGRRASSPMSGSDTAMAAAYSDLATEHKILKQELMLVRKEGDILRATLDHAGGTPVKGDRVSELAAQLEPMSRELSTLRVNHAGQQTARNSGAAGDSSTAEPELSTRLAAALRNSAQLQEENAQLRAEVDRLRTENNRLAEQVKDAALQASRTQLALAQLNTDLLAQKEAHARAEEAAETVRAQLNAVRAHQQNPTAETPRASPASPASTLQVSKAPAAGSSPTGVHLNGESLRTFNPPPSNPQTGRVHIVQTGDTLEAIARQYLGAGDRWRAIYEANYVLLGNGQRMRAGMELQIPDN